MPPRGKRRAKTVLVRSVPAKIGLAMSVLAKTVLAMTVKHNPVKRDPVKRAKAFRSAQTSSVGHVLHVRMLSVEMANRMIVALVIVVSPRAVGGRIHQRPRKTTRCRTRIHLSPNFSR